MGHFGLFLFIFFTLIILGIYKPIWKIIVGSASKIKKVVVVFCGILLVVYALYLAIDGFGIPKPYLNHIVTTSIEQLKVGEDTVNYYLEIWNPWAKSMRVFLIFRDDAVRIELPVSDALQLMNHPTPWGVLSMISDGKYRLILFGYSQKWIFEIDSRTHKATLIQVAPSGTTSCLDRSTGMRYTCPTGFDSGT